MTIREKGLGRYSIGVPPSFFRLPIIQIPTQTVDVILWSNETFEELLYERTR